MCLHSQAKFHPEISLVDGIKHDIARAIEVASIQQENQQLSEVSLEKISTQMKKASWATLRQLVKP